MEQPMQSDPTAHGRFRAPIMRRLAFFVLVVLLAVAAKFYATEPTEEPSNFVLHEAPKPLPEIAIADGEGKVGALSDFRGKVVLLNIWATWCVPCRKEMPTLDRLQAQLGGPGFEVVTLSIDRGGAGTVRKFYGEIGIQHLAVQLDAKAEAPSALGTFGLPTTLLIDRQGWEIGRLIGPAEWDSREMIRFLKTTIAQQDGQSLPAPNEENPK
jgi:thiol-disulfide isomerase/thioredoxin